MECINYHWLPRETYVRQDRHINNKSLVMYLVALDIFKEVDKKDIHKEYEKSAR